ncbi:MAG: hypothetical protein QG597_3100, partial [Actinomycetota bacterium]|nr:hypothetical protein [Actinomycetota bacterium]
AAAWTRAADQVEVLRQAAGQAQEAVVADALDAGVDWWTLGECLGIHPQEAWERFRGVVEGLVSPAAQRPLLAVVCTAGLDADHDCGGAGIDLEDLCDSHSLTRDPTVVRLRHAADLLGTGLWVSVRLPGDYVGADEVDDGEAVSRWTTVVLHADELGWLRQALECDADSNGAESERE